VGVASATVQGGLVGPVVARIGERRALLIGLSAGAAGFAVYGLAATGWVFAAGIPVMAFWGLYGPSAQGLMTRRVGPDQQGQLQGALQSVMGLTGIVGPGLFALTFSMFISSWRTWNVPGAAFLLASLLLVGAVVLAFRVTRPNGDVAT
jgi:DHA1 family tetracycline resistance protein-like MFS transporter